VLAVMAAKATRTSVCPSWFGILPAGDFQIRKYVPFVDGANFSTCVGKNGRRSRGKGCPGSVVDRSISRSGIMRESSSILE